MSLSFTEKWNQAIRRNNSLVCVGLDTDPAQLPACVRAKADPVLYFNQQIIDATCDLVCCYKPNFAFYSALGADGFATLKRTLDHIPTDIPVLIDAKVGDMGNTAEQYARAFYEVLGCDALTVTPYLGHDCVAPFTAYQDRTTFLVCLTSNPGADDFQKNHLGDQPLYEQRHCQGPRVERRQQHRPSRRRDSTRALGSLPLPSAGHTLANTRSRRARRLCRVGGQKRLRRSRRGHPHQLLARHPLRLPRQRFRGRGPAGDSNPAQCH